VAIHELPSAEAIERLIEGRVEIALAHNVASEAAYDVTVLHRDELYLVGSLESAGAFSSAPIPADDLAKYSIIVHSGRHNRRGLIDSAEVMAQRHVSWEWSVGSTDAVLDLVQGGFGYALVPSSVLRQRRDHFTMRPVVEPTLFSALCLLTPTRHPLTRLGTRVRDILRETVDRVISSQATTASGPGTTRSVGAASQGRPSQRTPARRTRRSR
jgi:LysR family nitrogen assimilation transcriptional regulator